MGVARQITGRDEILGQKMKYNPDTKKRPRGASGETRAERGFSRTLDIRLSLPSTRDILSDTLQRSCIDDSLMIIATMLLHISS